MLRVQHSTPIDTQSVRLTLKEAENADVAVDTALIAAYNQRVTNCRREYTVSIGDIMNARGHIAPILAVAFIVLYPGRVLACPACNIHNYLAASVRSSTDIFHGEVLRQVDDKTAEIKVLRVLRGKRKIGAAVKSRMYGAKKYVGEEFIFSNPTSHQPTFEVLQLKHEDEVLFLIQKESSVDSVEEAIKRVQGVSVVTDAENRHELSDRSSRRCGRPTYC